MNTITLTGRATRDLELRFTQNGKGVASGSIAVQRNFKNQNGEYEADFFDFVAWGKTGEIMADYIKKGDKFGISGRLQSRVWEKDDETKVKVVEVNVNEFDFPEKPKSTNQSNNQQKQNTSDTEVDIDDSDLPF